LLFCSLLGSVFIQPLPDLLVLGVHAIIFDLMPASTLTFFDRDNMSSTPSFLLILSLDTLVVLLLADLVPGDYRAVLAMAGFGYSEISPLFLYI
jgi:hypothetical protein